MEYRIAELKDLDEIHSLIVSATDAMINQNIFQWDEIYPNKAIVEEDILNNQLYYGKIDNEIAVIFTVNRECDEGYTNGTWEYTDNNYCVVHRLCVKSEYQNKGLGKMTMLFIEDMAGNMGVTSIRLDAFSENPAAIKLYESLDFKIAGFAYWRKGKFLLMEKILKK